MANILSNRLLQNVRQPTIRLQAHHDTGGESYSALAGHRRVEPFTSRQHFSLPVRFDHQGEDWINNAWSLVVDVEGIPEAQGHQAGTAKFVMLTLLNDR